MGAYLSCPETAKDSIEGQNGRLRFAATSMQGWRVSQEDAHNCLEDLIDGWSMFSVYDGHGGCEVAQYTAKMLPDLIRVSEFEKADDVTKILQDVFINFDEHLRSETAIEKMEAIATASTKESGDKDEESEVNAVINEATLPLHEILAKYGLAILRKPLARKKQAFIEENKDENNEEEMANRDSGEEKSDVVHTKRSTSPAGKPVKRAKLDDEQPPKETADDMETNQEPTKEEKQNANTAEADESNKAEVSNSDDTSDEEFLEESDEDDDEEMSDECEDWSEERIENADFPMESPNAENKVAGVDSGTTACVCLVGKEKVIVANIGDSRAVMFHAGTAFDLSSDHKPEDAIEKERIQAAGGIITDDGRVCGGLNLSRALGDHFYKKIQTLTPEDEFLVVACDGIWNSMSSQEVVDFIKERLEQKKPLKDIVEELCDSCLAENSGGDGTGCDNMTCIIVDFRNPTTEHAEKESPNELLSKVDNA
ncbi:unnamed protein product, partial [Mesorhabditis belari]|uniref:protein-serine/threonine phosphatase n=1 Tax=Mesorhabditis belari TaxID=2138241 RepID=A0AAF3J7J7_9BILA